MDNHKTAQEITDLKQVLETTKLPTDLKVKVDALVKRLERIYDTPIFFQEYEKTSHLLDWLTKLPWDNYSQDNLDIQHARQVFDKHHYGIDDVKERLLEYIAVLNLNHRSSNQAHVVRAPIILLVGLVGTGKTTFAYSIAEALNRQIVRIPFGGMGSARDLRGQSRLHPEAEPGYIIKSLVRCQTRNPVILLDEIDRVSEHAQADIMGVLVEMLDPEQNHAFLDHYIDYPFDLSDIIFIATANGTSHIATAVLDRMETITMPSYTDEEKIAIGKNYILPKAIKEAALPPDVLKISDESWLKIVRPLGYDSGIRSLQRNIKGIVRKVAKLYVEGQIQQIVITPENSKQYLPSYKTELI